MKNAKLDTFNNIMLEFLNDLCVGFPDFEDFKTMLGLVSVMNQFAPTKALENYLEVAGHYHQEILDEKEVFFTNLSNWKNDPFFQKEFQGQEDDMIQKLVIFKDIWGDLSDTSKDKIWAYLARLLVSGAIAGMDNNPKLCKTIIEYAKKKHMERNAKNTQTKK